MGLYAYIIRFIISVMCSSITNLCVDSKMITYLAPLDMSCLQLATFLHCLRVLKCE